MLEFLKFKLKYISRATDDQTSTTSIDVVNKFLTEIDGMKIDNQPFRLSGLLHILTNRVRKILHDNRHNIYYDVENEVGRYIIGDNDYIDQKQRAYLIDYI